MIRLTTAASLVLVTLTASACAGAKRPVLHTAQPPAGASLWEAPTDLASRDLYNGPWGAENAPDPGDTFTFVERKHTGINLGMTVADSKGREWSVKQPYPGGFDGEAQVEVVLSRLLSGIGYHQPPAYYLPSFRLNDGVGTHVEVGGRFRLKRDDLKDAGIWSWSDNPFVGSRPYQGLLALLIMFNSTDLKDMNNTLFERQRGAVVEKWYVARDLGAALGDTQSYAPFKNRSDVFVESPYILGVKNGFVEFAYNGWYKNLVRERITPEDVAWASNLLGQLNDRQWRDAFRAASYPDGEADQFIRALKARVAQGRALAPRAANDERQ